MLSERIQGLRKRSLEAVPTLSLERAELLTEFYEGGIPDRVSVPVGRALAFRHILEHKRVSIEAGELIVGERGPAPKATATYPEICAHSLSDLEILDSREKIPYKVRPEAKRVTTEKIEPFWRGRSIRDRIFEHVDQNWKDAYSAGIFTEFMEQRAPGHTVLGDVIYRKGLLDLKEEALKRIETLDFLEDPDALDRREELRAMAIAAEAVVSFAGRYVDEAARSALETDDAGRKKELEDIARICRRVPASAPETFHEALQYYWFVHLGVITELNTWDSFNPGRLDQHLYPFFKRDLGRGTLTEDQARELLQAFWIKFNNQPAPPKVGVTAKESNTYTDFCLINVGGVTPEGDDGVNELSFLILDVIQEMRLLQPSSMVQISRKTPDRFLNRALRIIRTGFGQPSIFNTDAIVQELLRQGKSLMDARCGGASGCVEAGAFGKEAYILTGYFNLTKVFEVALNNGYDTRTQKQLGPTTGHPQEWSTVDDMFDAFETQLKHFLDVKIKGNRIIERLYATYLPAPFLSLLVEDCIANGKDYNAGGARYNTSYVQGVGLGTVTDSMAAIAHHVFDKKSLAMDELLSALVSNFAHSDRLRRRLVHNTPKYGNDDPAADKIMQRVFDAYFRNVDGRPNTRGGKHHINLLPTTCHVYFGSVIGATPDGRRAGEPLSEGISPVQGADRKGPTAVLRSAAKMDHLLTGGTLLNQKFTPDFLSDEKGIDSVKSLVRAYFALDGHHIQFNVVSAETLRQAQNDPEKYSDLIVRVAGYSDYFVDLTPELQEEIIRRTEHASA
jgi:formate C-acetyltransferase